MPTLWDAEVDKGTCNGLTELKDGETCAVSCNSTISDPQDGQSNYTYSCTDGTLNVPLYKCSDSMWIGSENDARKLWNAPETREKEHECCTVFRH